MNLPYKPWGLDEVIYGKYWRKEFVESVGLALVICGKPGIVFEFTVFIYIIETFVRMRQVEHMDGEGGGVLVSMNKW